MHEIIARSDLRFKYSHLFITNLIERISVYEDNDALNHFLTFKRMLSINGRRVLLPDFLQK